MQNNNILEIKDLHAKAEDGKIILTGVNLTIKSGETHVIMGPNGSGKSTFCDVLMGRPKYKITKGKIIFNGKDITKLSTDKKARLGMFLSFQHPVEIPGVSVTNFLKTALNARQNKENKKFFSTQEVYETIEKKAKKLKLDPEIIKRSLNESLSGGEKKRSEILQMAILKPKIAILDEIDSGLDIDALKNVASMIKEVFKETQPGLLLITHYQRLLNYIEPDHIHIMAKGKILKSGKKALAEELEELGYESYTG